MRSIFLLFAIVLALDLPSLIGGQEYEEPYIQPEATAEDCTCSITDTVCKCELVISHRLTMVLDDKRQIVYPVAGRLRQRNETAGPERELTDEEAKTVITADGSGSRLVIAINGKFPGPRILVYKDQVLEVTVINTLHTDSVTIHFHGLHQIGTPWMDGVAFVTQCPVFPGQTFVYRFKATPSGTSFYHAHIGDQRSMGLYGPVVVRPVKQPTIRINDEIIVTLQDWNHLMDAETAYHRMITEQFDFTGQYPIPISTTYSLDFGNFSRFEFHSGLINGKGRYWRTAIEHNQAPLERFKVRSGNIYRFRVIGAMTLYPMRVYIPTGKFQITASDGFIIKTNESISSLVIQPGERLDFTWQVPGTPDRKQYMLVAESLETPESIGDKYHAAEAIIEIEDYIGEVDINPPKADGEVCTLASTCKTFNCPYGNHGVDTRSCLNFEHVVNNDEDRDPAPILGDSVDEEFFFNFAFPGFPGNTPGSVNGREFVSPTSNLLTQFSKLKTRCDAKNCPGDDICKCTYIVDIPFNKRIQMVFSNIGKGSGWSHPIHLHGHSFYVMKVGLGTYAENGRLLNETRDLQCLDANNFCTSAGWTNSSWDKGNLPGMNTDPPEKDTIIVPTGGYIVVRFISNNPGMWFLHCHIDLHNTNGMGMVINEGYEMWGKPPAGFPVCGNFLHNEVDEAGSTCAAPWTSVLSTAVIVTVMGIHAVWNI